MVIFSLKRVVALKIGEHFASDEAKVNVKAYRIWFVLAVPNKMGIQNSQNHYKFCNNHKVHKFIKNYTVIIKFQKI